MLNEPNAKRCSDCDIDWPYIGEFDTCGVCLEPTWKAGSSEPLSISAARKLVNEAKARRANEELFEEYYAEHAVRQLGEAIEEWGVIEPQPAALDETGFQRFLRNVAFTPEP